MKRFQIIITVLLIALFINCTEISVRAAEQDNWIEYAVEPKLYGTTYEIYAPGELAWVMKQSNEGNSFSFYSIRLFNDIDLSNHIWTPVNNFAGSFNGAGHSITGVKIVESPKNGYCGFFGLLTGSVTDLKIAGEIECSPACVGGLVGFAYNASISYCSAEFGITINGTSTTGTYSPRVGILAGFALGSTISTSCSTGTISGGMNASNGCAEGGLIGCTQTTTISDSYAQATITETYTGGGLIGEVYRGCVINNCYASTSIGAVSSRGYRGGFIGESDYTNLTVSNSYWNKDLIDVEHGHPSYSEAGAIALGLTTEQLNKLSDIAEGWDFDAVWMENDNDEMTKLHPKPYITVETIQISAESVALKQGESCNITVSFTPSNATDQYVRWTSDDPEIVTVDNGVVTGIRTGDTVIYATAVDTGYTVSCKITVTKKWLETELIAPTLENSTFSIQNESNLAWVMYKVSTGSSFSGYTLRLLTDLDLSTYEWSPIGGFDYLSGDVDSSKAFSGIFDGNFHSICGVSVGSSSNYSGLDYCGLFGITNGATIRDLNVESTTVYSNGECVGGLIGRSASTEISNCAVTGEINARSTNCGGLIGTGSATMLNCSFEGEIANAGLESGGLVGGSYSTGELLLDSCKFSGNLRGKSYVGGLIGIGDQNLRAMNCEVDGSIYASQYWVGGLCGKLSGSIENSSNTATVASASYTFTGCKVGGLSGTVEVGGRIVNCYSSADVTGYGITQTNNGSVVACYYDGDKDVYRVDASETGSEDLNSPLTSEQITGDYLVNQLNSLFVPGWKDWAISSDKAPYLSTSGIRGWNSFSAEPTYRDGKYHITTAGELAWLSNQIVAGNSFNGETIILDANIDLSEKYWIPIGGWNGYSSDASFCFQGSFDGNGYEITGLRIGSAVYPYPFDYAGLFGCCDGASVYSLLLQGTVESSGNTTGLLCGYAKNSTIKACIANGSVTGKSYTGLFAGNFTNNGVAKTFTQNCGSGSVLGYDYIGGLIGYYYFSGHIVVNHITESAFVGSVSGHDDVGGIVGRNSGAVATCFVRGTVSGRYEVGGLIGNTSTALVSDCYSICELEGTSGVGAIVGYAKSTCGEGCYWCIDSIQTVGGYQRDDFEKQGVGTGTENTTSMRESDMKTIELLTALTSSVWRQGGYNDGLPYFSSIVENSEITNVKLLTSEGNETANIVQGTLDLTCAVADYRGEVLGNLFVATYNSNGKMLNICMEPVYLTSQEKKEYATKIDNTSGNVSSIKIFFVNDCGIPQCRNAVIGS